MDETKIGAIGSELTVMYGHSSPYVWAVGQIGDTSCGEGGS